MKRTTTALSIVALLLAGPPLGCSGEAPPPTAGAPEHDDHGHEHPHDDHAHDGDHAHAEAGDDHAHDDESAHIEIPPAVRANLGISFVEAQARWIEQTIRVPGRFEYLPTARREYRTAIPGRVELRVEQFERVEAGRTLYEIDSPAWRDLQQAIAEATARIASLAGRLETFAPLEAAHRAHERSLLESIDVWEQRVAQLEAVREAGGGRTEDLAGARAALASTRAELAKVQETEAELTADRAQMQADMVSARDRRAFLLESAASLVGMDASSLDETVDGNARPRWATINAIAVRATESGVVESLGLTNGSWADETAAVVTVVRPDRLRFRASGLQSDLGVLRDGLPARIVSPAPTNDRRGVPLDQAMAGTLRVGLAGNADDRTLELFVTPDTLLDWARPGVSAQLEIVTDETAEPVLAVPLAAVQRDGLRPVLFRRAPDDPDEAERIEPVLGPDDGRWITILEGVRMGDAIVLDGAFQLMLATSGSAQKGGHFHADGTFHEEEHDGEGKD